MAVLKGAIINAVRQSLQDSPEAQALVAGAIYYGVMAALFLGALFALVKFVKWAWGASLKA